MAGLLTAAGPHCRVGWSTTQLDPAETISGLARLYRWSPVVTPLSVGKGFLLVSAAFTAIINVVVGNKMLSHHLESWTVILFLFVRRFRNRDLQLYFSIDSGSGRRDGEWAHGYHPHLAPESSVSSLFHLSQL